MAPTDWPETDNYFSFYGLEPDYAIDAILLKQQYLDKSRKFHPDFFGDDMAEQSKAIEITAYNNKAFRILNQPVERIRYLISMNDAEDNEKDTLPQDFLMEMLDLNEEIDAFEFGDNKEILKQKIESEIDVKIQQLMALLTDLANRREWQAAKSELLKLNYLERLQSRLQIA